MEKILPYIIVALVILMAVFIIIRHIRKMIKGENSCSSCTHDCSSCGVYKSGKSSDKGQHK